LDIRLIASTSRDLAGMVRAGDFNAELYHHLTAFNINLLPLRMRTMDIPQLVRHFVDKHASRMNKRITAIPRETMDVLCAGQWPGNARELENFIERAVILTEGSTLYAPLVELGSIQNDNLEVAERRHILQVLRKTNGVVGGPSGAAERLGLKRTTLNSRLKKLGITKSTHADLARN
jgi:transcriptional regulator with GAF, ATPase, and Fis domain